MTTKQIKNHGTTSVARELNKIAGDWTTCLIKNDYTYGSTHFTLRYKDEKITFQHEDVLTVGVNASAYNGLSPSECRRLYTTYM